jgi:hypothetical protein
MKLKEFAVLHSLRVRRSREDDTDNIVGKFGEIYEYGDGTLGVMVLPDLTRHVEDYGSAVGTISSRSG